MPQNYAKMLRNLTFVVLLNWSNQIKEESNKMFLSVFYKAAFEVFDQLSLQKAIFDFFGATFKSNFLRSCGQLHGKPQTITTEIWEITRTPDYCHGSF